MKQIETKKKSKKPYTGQSRSTQWRKEKKKKIETKKEQEKIVLKQEKNTKLIALGLGEEQSKSLSDFVVDNPSVESEDIEKLIEESLKMKMKARTELDSMVVDKLIEIEDAKDWAFMRKALE